MLKETLYGVKADGTVDQVDILTKAVTKLPVTGISRVIAQNSGFVVMVKTGGTGLLFGGNVAAALGTFKGRVFKADPPPGDKFFSVGGGYQGVYATTEAGLAYILVTAMQPYFPYISGISSSSPDFIDPMPPWYRINLPRPVETVSMQETSPGGSQGCLILP